MDCIFSCQGQLLCVIAVSPPPRPPPPSPQLLRFQSCRLQPGGVLLSSSSPTKVSCFRSVSGDYFTLGTMRNAACLRLFFHCKNCVGVEMRCCFFVFFPFPLQQGEELECDFGTEQRYEATWLNGSTVKCSGVTVSSGPNSRVQQGAEPDCNLPATACYRGA